MPASEIGRIRSPHNRGVIDKIGFASGSYGTASEGSETVARYLCHPATACVASTLRADTQVSCSLHIVCAWRAWRHVGSFFFFERMLEGLSVWITALLGSIKVGKGNNIPSFQGTIERQFPAADPSLSPSRFMTRDRRPRP